MKRMHQSVNQYKLPRNHGFTLVEVLVVISIIAILSSMAMPIITIASRAAKKTATRSVMIKVDTAIRLFKSEVGSYPFQRAYADTAAGETPSNRLAYNLGTKLSAAAIAKLHVDANAAAGQYAYPCPGRDEQLPAVSPHVFLKADIKPSPSTNGDESAWKYENNGNGVWSWVPHSGDSGSKLGTATMLNRMGAERARLAIFAGNLDLPGCVMADAMHPNGGVYQAGRSNAGIKVLSGVAQTEADPGWANDYLRGELEQRYIQGDTILDAWKKPLVYVGQVVEGMESTRGFIMQSSIRWIDPRVYGLVKIGRRTLAPLDSVTGDPLADTPPSLPDATNLKNSDRRYWAGPGYEFDIELWSAGPDGRFDWMRNNQANADNVPLAAYDAEIQ